MKGDPECSDRCPCQDPSHPMHEDNMSGRIYFAPLPPEDNDGLVVAYQTDSGVRVLFEDDDEGRWDEE